MFTLIQAHDFHQNQHLLEAGFRLRKKVFHDQLAWDVPVVGDMEFDRYDTADAQYLMWCSPDRRKLYGMIRLMPTSGPTLLFDVFGATHGNAAELIGDTILEGTRMCIDEELVARDFPTLEPGAAFNLLFLALCEACLALGAVRMVSNFEPAMSRIYRRAGLAYDLKGKASGYGKRPVCCGAFDVSMQVLAQMRRTIGIDLPLVTVLKDFTPLPKDAPAKPLTVAQSA